MGCRGPEPEEHKKTKTLQIPGLSDKRPSPPSGMTKVARKLWKEIVASLPSTHFRPGDYPLLRDYCEAESTILRMRSAIEQEGDFVPGARGGTVAHPGYAVITASSSAKSMLATKLRLCANSRLSNDKAAREKIEEPVSKRKGLMFGG